MGFQKNEQGEWVFRVDEKREFRRGYETAAWYSIIEVEAGDYPVTFTTVHGEKVDTLEEAYYVNALLAGRLTYDYLPSLYGGVKIGEGSTGERDEPTVHHIQTYAFMVKDKVAA